MPRTALTVQTPKGPFPGAVAATDLDYTYTAADVANKNDFVLTGREMILCRNSDGTTPHNVTFTSVNDPQLRPQDITTYAIALNGFSIFWAGSVVGWRQTDGKFYLEADDAQILFAIVKIPS